MSEARKQQEIAFRKNLIIEAAKTIFFRDGFEHSTMEDIAGEVGYSKGSLYSYFNSKNEICFTIVNDYFSHILDMIQKVFSGSSSGLDKLIAIKDNFAGDYAQNLEFCNIYETFKYHRAQCSEVENEIKINESYNHRISELISGIVHKGIEDGSIKDKIDVSKLSRALWNGKNCFIAETMFSESNAYDYLFDLIIDTIKNKVEDI